MRHFDPLVRQTIDGWVARMKRATTVGSFGGGTLWPFYLTVPRTLRSAACTVSLPATTSPFQTEPGPPE